MHPSAIEPFAGHREKDSTLAEMQDYLPMIVKRTTQTLIRTRQTVNRPVPAAHRGMPAAAEYRRPVVAEPDMEMVQRLNEIAKRHPFSTYYKNRKHDPL